MLTLRSGVNVRVALLVAGMMTSARAVASGTALVLQSSPRCPRCRGPPSSTCSQDDTVAADRREGRERRGALVPMHAHSHPAGGTITFNVIVNSGRVRRAP